MTGTTNLPGPSRRAVLAAAGLGAIAIPSVAHAAPRPSGLGPLSVTATPDTQLNAMFTNYGNTGGQWVGADSTYSVRLKDGRTAWVFSDTIYGDVVNGTLSPTDSFFINNSIIVQDGQKLSTVTGGTSDHPEAIVGMDGDAWHWFGAAQTRPNGDVQIGVLRFERFGTGAWDWGWKSNRLVTLDRRTLKPRSVTPLPSAAGVQWASWFLQQPGVTYVYGVEDLGASKYMHLARVRSGDLSSTGKWEYWTGSGWSRTETDSARIIVGVSNEYSVTAFGGGYLLITQDTNELFSSRILAYRSDSLTGPFVDPIEVYRMPEVGPFGSYGDPNIFGYNPHEHPELRRGNELVISYNINTFDNMAIYDDVTIYRPRFIRATFTHR
ncbi:hypothetical protein BW730_11375 [Tessaracoccus aquimaris]|uniref:DUF4185 domain-containing protein n=1 Tax=Tessaracoccus aquimaris TaxID=1332264 RepID=A0A1Q2CT94_9ACTN|nr:DUF4185 domain-containing protein [Tessaracoccus aquimaris]AQP49344.1 hypothetical protein BW730_11375 [Tessaracoccus aquimaris]